MNTSQESVPVRSFTATVTSQRFGFRATFRVESKTLTPKNVETSASWDRPDGGEIVMRELVEAKAEAVERLRQFNTAKDQRDAERRRADHNVNAVNENADMIVRLRAEVDRYRNGCAQANQQGEEAQAELRGLRVELAEAKADVDDLRRQLLDETYRPEGGEIVMRELIDAKAALHKALSREITLAAQVAAVRALADKWADAQGLLWCSLGARALRAALDGTEQDEAKRPVVPPPDPRMAVRPCCGDVHFGDDCDPSAGDA